MSHLNTNIKLDLKSKIAQMLILGFDGSSIDKSSIIAKEISQYNLGGVILFDYNFKTKSFDKNILNIEQVKKLNKNLISFNNSGIPLIISVDHEGGKVSRLKNLFDFNKINHGKSAVEIGKLEYSQVESIAYQMASDLKNLGFNLNFVPVVDVDNNPDNPIIAKLDRSFSSDPKIVKKYAEIFVKVLLNNKVLCCYKHFPGHGSSTKDSHLGFVDVTDTWQELELEPYINTNSPMLMTAHIINKKLDPSGLPATMSKKILTDLLRTKLNYNGVIVSDDLQMKAITDHYSLEESLVKTINAGADMLIFGNQLVDKRQNAEEIIELIYKNINNNTISEDRINNSFERIIKLKEYLL